MTCEMAREELLDVVYGEETPVQVTFGLFKHMEGCGDCSAEYKELLETRKMLGTWQPEVAEGELRPIKNTGKLVPFRLSVRTAGRLIQQAAAVLLILVGGWTLLQSSGVVGSKTVTVSEEQLLQMVNDMVVARQAEERRLIGQALVNLADEVSLRQRSEMQGVSDQLRALEYRYVENMEETNRHLEVLLTR